METPRRENINELNISREISANMEKLRASSAALKSSFHHIDTPRID